MANTASVTPIHPATELRPLPYRAHLSMPADRHERIEWAIEQQLSLASDFQEVSLGDVLLVFAADPALLGREIDTLIDLSTEANDALLNGPTRRWQAATAAYRAQLSTVATLVRAL